MEKELFVRAEEVARELGISKPYAYKLVREMNEELKKKGIVMLSALLNLSEVLIRKSVMWLHRYYSKDNGQIENQVISG